MDSFVHYDQNLADLISPMQSNFLPGRKSADNIILLQEVARHFQKITGKTALMILKLDLDKPYDRREWSFIKETLLFFNFLRKISDIIMNCISGSSLSIIVNGSISESFTPSRGIKQGNPLSPYLFILCMEYFSLRINQEVDLGLWSCFSLAHGGPLLALPYFVC